MTFRRSYYHLLALSGVVAAAGTLGLARIAQAGQNALGDIIYRGEPKAISGVTARAWGSGVVAEDTMMHLSGSQSIKITTHGFHQGASLVFNTPVNFASYLNNKDAYLQFAVNVRSSTTASAGGMGGAMGMMGGGSAGGGPGGRGGRGAMGQMGGGSAGGGPGGRGSATAQKARDIQNLRVQMITTKGNSTEFLLPLEYGATQDTWKMLTIPIAAIGLKLDAAAIKEIRVFGDAPGVMNLGQIRTLVDATPITVERITNQTIAQGSTVTFRARASAGAVPLKFAWDFDEKDGIQEEKVGRAAQFRYRKSGEYMTTITVTDVYGQRDPKTIKFKVFVP